MRVRLIAALLSSFLISTALAGCVAAPTPITQPPSSASGSPPATAAAVSSDIDGDGKRDSLSLKRVKGHWRLKVVTASGSASFTSPDWDGLFDWDEPEVVGLAPLDPVPGSELIFHDLSSDDTLYEVLTWRDGQLVEAQNPAGTSNRWVIGDEFGTYTAYTFSAVNGQAALTTSEATFSDPVTFTQYAWISGTWVAQRTWTEDLDQAARAALCTSFCGVDIQPVTLS